MHAEEGEKKKNTDPLIYVLDIEDIFCVDVQAKLKQSNYRLNYYSTLSDFDAACSKAVPSAIIINMVLNNNTALNNQTVVGAGVVEKLDKENNDPLLIYVSNRDDIEMRLAAARDGDYFLSTPLNCLELTKVLDECLGNLKTVNAYKTLVIGDNEGALTHYSEILKNSGMIVRELNQPLACLNVLSEFKPDIVILDVDISECSAPELTQVIRQDSTWYNMPILFVSTDTKPAKQQKYLKLTGDVVLEKNVKPSVFLASVDTLIKRGRKERSQGQIAAELLRDSADIFRLQYERSEDPMAIFFEDTIVMANDAANKLFGHDGFVGAHPADLSPEYQSDGTLSVDSAQQKIVTAYRDGHERFEWLHKKTNGDEFLVDVSLTRIAYDGQCALFCVFRDISEAKSLENLLINAKKEAESANASKSQFLSSMSHELRTPMNAIMGFSQLLNIENDPPLNESQQENVDEIIKATNHLLTLINEVLDLSKIESGGLELSIESVMLGTVISESIKLIEPLAQKRGIEIKIRWDNSAITIEGLLTLQCVVVADYTKLKQALLNLLSNAVKYNSENGNITIELDCQESTKLTRISIRDTGQGLTQEQQSHLFTAFKRLGAEQTQIEGVGVGLVISKKIIEAMAGSIGVESHVGEGSVFWLELPSGVYAAKRDTDINELGEVITIEPSQDIKVKKTVLYIEDNPANLRLVKQVLERMPNVCMLGADNPGLGLELSITHLPDLILLDINLPDIDGFEVLKKLKSQAETNITPIIAISANAMPKDIDRGIEAGFDHYITKPIDVTELQEVVKSILSTDD